MLLLEWTLHYCNKIKVGDLSLTKESYFKKLGEELIKGAKELEERKKTVDTKFSEISDVELIDELKKRTGHQAIKLSMYSSNNFVSIEGQDIRCGSSVCLPIEIKEKDNV